MKILLGTIIYYQHFNAYKKKIVTIYVFKLLLLLTSSKALTRLIFLSEKKIEVNDWSVITGPNDGKRP